MHFPVKKSCSDMLLRQTTSDSAIAPTVFPTKKSPAARCCRFVCGLLLIAFCLPATATTLVRCKIDKKVVYSDTECPGVERNRTGSFFMSDKPSKPVHIRYSKKKTVGNLSPAKSRNRAAAR